MKKADLPDVIERLKREETLKEIAQAYGTTPPTIRMFIRDYAPEYRGINTPRARKERREKALKKLNHKLKSRPAQDIEQIIDSIPDDED
jgi:hypothetical protein